MTPVAEKVSMLDLARHYVAAGLSVIPCGIDKRPVHELLPTGKWKPFQRRLPTDDELQQMFGSEPPAIAIICGVVSGGVEVIDFDNPEKYPAWRAHVEANDPGLAERVPLVRTPSGGFHVPYRTPHCEGSQKLAMAPDRETWIETKGEGGYVLAPASPGYTLEHGRYSQLPELGAEERDLLIDAARRLSGAKENERRDYSGDGAPQEASDRPGDVFNGEGWPVCRELLRSHGWALVRTYERGKEEWRRPGKDEGISATFGHHEGMFYVFSSNGHPFEADRKYSPFSVYGILAHGGDFNAAARAVALKGYGQSRPETSVYLDEGEPTGDGGANAHPSAPPRTELETAEFFVEENKGDLRFVPAWKEWLHWTGSRFQRDDTLEAQRRMHKAVRTLQKRAADIDDDELRKKALSWALKCESASKIRNILALAQPIGDVPIRVEELDTDPWLLNVRNCTIDLRTGQPKAHRRKDLITKLAPVDFDDSATCPLWIKTVTEIFDGDRDLVRHFQACIGYSLTGDQSEQCLFILHGEGSNGKSTIINTVSRLLGDYANPARPEMLMTRRFGGGPSEDEAALKGSRMVVAAEPSSGARLNEALVKRLTGGDPIKARFLHSNPFEFEPTHKLWLLTNHKPVIKDTDHAIWRRIHLIPFDVTFSDDRKDKDLPKKLEAEASGILNWMIEGCMTWQREGLPKPGRVDEATAGYRSEMDLIQGFIDECCTVTKDMSVEGESQASSLYSEYKKWAGSDAESQQAFGRALSERGFDRIRRRDGYYYRGIGIAFVEDENNRRHV